MKILGLQEGFEICFYCGDPDEGDGYLHNGVPMCMICEDMHELLRKNGQPCCLPSDWSVGVELD